MFKTKVVGFILLVLLFNSFNEVYYTSHLCFPSNNGQVIPVFDDLGNEVRTGLTKEEFYLVLDELKEVYTPVFEGLGKTFLIMYLWTKSRVLSTALQAGNDWTISMFGGLARHKHTTLDSFRLAACHEIGHHLGGAPTQLKKIKDRWSSSWSSTEGQADYYASFICMKKLIMEGQKQALEVAAPDLSIYEDKEYTLAETACSKRFTDEQTVEGLDSNYRVCLRTVLAGLSLGRSLVDGSNPDVNLSLGTPDDTVVSAIEHNRYPRAQCRVDTYMASALCDNNIQVVLDKEDPNLATCNRVDGFEYGLRPLCWYKPVGKSIGQT